MNSRRLLRRSEASEYLRERFGLSYKPTTLAKLAVLGGGPRFKRFGRVPLYEPVELDRWVAERLSEAVSSTSELNLSSAV